MLLDNIFKKNSIHPDHVLMKEEVAATWFATALIMGVLGANFSDRVTVAGDTRQVVDILFLSIAILITIWALLSLFNMMSFAIHRLGLILIVLATIGSFSYLIALSGQNKL